MKVSFAFRRRRVLKKQNRSARLRPDVGAAKLRLPKSTARLYIVGGMKVEEMINHFEKALGKVDVRLVGGEVHYMIVFPRMS